MTEKSESLAVTVIEQCDAANLKSGGIDTIIHDFVKFSSDIDFSIIGGTSDPDVPLGVWCSITISGARVAFLPVCRINKEKKGRLKIPDSLQLALGCVRYIRKLDLRTVHVHRVELGFLASIFGTDNLTQFIHNDSKGLLGRQSDSVWRHLAPVYKWIERWTLRRSNSVVLFNKGDSERISSVVPGLIVAETWFDPEYFCIRDELNFPSKFSLCWIGRFESQKDPVLAVEVLGALHRCGLTDARLTMVGTGSLMAKAALRASELGVTDQIRFAGLVSRSEVATILLSGSLLLMTSHYEGSPTVLVEAAAIGLPVVATKESDPDGVLIPGRTGELASRRDPEELAKYVVKAVEYNPGDCRRQVEHRSAPTAVPTLLRNTRE